MIYTVTLNPAIDYETEIEQINLGSINRIDEQHFIPGGKGINVSRGLSYLGIVSKAVGFIGGFTGHFMKESLTHENFDSQFVFIKDITRLNIKIHTLHQDSEINGKSPRISMAETEELLRILDDLKDEDYLILSGSQPRVHTNLYTIILNRYQHLDLHIILDVPGIEYKELLKYHPLLVKPNLDELRDFINEDLFEIKGIIKAGKKMIEEGSQAVFISLGKDGSIYLDKTHIYHVKPITGTPKRLFGAGDHLVAGFVFGHLKGLTTIDKLKYSTACASLHIFDQTGYNQIKVEDFIHDITVEEIPYD